ncbi:hypothetical protein [Aquabacterium sp. OR-4]|uniref:hypothetical protein n=1 Tax=Aquabacterium sp. OR-4 TaxID=2978127 RepID=UPI0021B39BA7|nr:hypothetical protein [Aquabacterium sp. OR-4]MDT7838211.1 hypothetical protein [Aquabacterium sp. OR-4]
MVAPAHSGLAAQAPASGRGMASAPLSCLVSGLGPDDGEDEAALALVHRLRGLGGTVAAMTPLACDGLPAPGGGLHSARVARLAAAASFHLPAHAVCPFVLPAQRPASGPGAARVAASADGPGLRAQPVREAFQVLATWADAVVVAGIGGWLSPAVAEGAPATGPLLARMARRLHLPLLLCVRLTPGAAQRARLAVAEQGARPVAWLATGGPWPPPAAGPATALHGAGELALVSQALGVPCAGHVPLADGPPGAAPAHAASLSAAAAAGIHLAELLPRLVRQPSAR